MKLSFIGAGKMATAIGHGLITAKCFEKHDIIASAPSKKSQQLFSNVLGIRCVGDNDSVIEFGDVIILAVKPQNIEDVFSGLSSCLKNKLIISIIAGCTLNTLSVLAQSKRIIRVMPNTPAMVGEGATVFTCGTGITPSDKSLVTKIFNTVGIVKELPEKYLDVVTAVSGSGPAYVFEFIQSWVDAAAANDLDPELSLELILQTISGAVKMIDQNMGTPDELRIAVTSPKGTTEAGLNVLKKHHFRQIILDVISNAKQRSAELGNA